jgi:protein-tyrosine phosphatase
MPGGTRPISDRNTESDLRELHARGVRYLVSLQQMSLRFGDQCRAAGIEWIAYPIMDFEVPGNRATFSDLVDRLVTQINDNNPVCVHCRAGVGRTGMVLACIVGRMLGLDADAAIAFVRKSRSAMDTGEQIEFVHDFLRPVE